MSFHKEKPWLKNYDSHVSSNLPLLDCSFLEVLEKGLNADPEKIALAFLGSTYTYAQIEEISNRFARYLTDKGCRKGDVVGFCLPNTPQYIFALVGTLKAGCIVTGISPLLTAREMLHQLNDSKARFLLILDMMFQKQFTDIAGQVPALEHVVLTGLFDCLPDAENSPSGEALPSIAGKEIINFRDLVSAFPPKRPEVTLVPEDTCLIYYTGGTTGPSKGVVLTHKNQTFGLSVMMNWTDDTIEPQSHPRTWERGKEIMCTSFPLFHIAGIAIHLNMLAMGNTLVMVLDPRNTSQLCRDLKTYKPSVLMNVPTLFQMLMDDPDFNNIDLSDVKFCISGAAPLDPGTMKRLQSTFYNADIIELYGLTETNGTTIMNPAFGKKKMGSIGVPVQSTRVKIISTGDGTTVMPHGKPGEILVSGPQVMRGYFNNPKATEKAFVILNGERYFYTGDVGYMDEDGFVFIVDRTKDMILVGGYNVYSRQVEDIIYELEEIDMAAVIGEPNPERPGSEIVKAVIQLKNPQNDENPDTVKKKITKYCREHLSPYKVPRIIEFTKQMPLTAVGKVDKKMLRN